MLALNDYKSRLIKFLSSSPTFIGQAVARDETDLPNWVVWFAGVGVASDEFIHASNCDDDSPPEGWRSDRPGVYWKPIGVWSTLFVRSCSSQLWTIERETWRKEILFTISTIICAREPEAAMRLAEFCHPLPPGLCVPLQWRERNEKCPQTP
jgi:hypothetical protein